MKNARIKTEERGREFFWCLTFYETQIEEISQKSDRGRQVNHTWKNPRVPEKSIQLKHRPQYSRDFYKSHEVVNLLLDFVSDLSALQMNTKEKTCIPHTLWNIFQYYSIEFSIRLVLPVCT